MEIAPVPRPRPVLTAARLLVLLAVLVPVLGAALLPVMLGFEQHVMTSGSMAGAADRGSVVLTQEVPVGALRVGDVISFDPPGWAGGSEPVTHRIIDLGPGGARTQGDANTRPDPWVVPLEEPTASRMILAVPWVGQPFLGDRPGGFWLGLVGLPLAALVGVAALRRRQALVPAFAPPVAPPAVPAGASPGARLVTTRVRP